MKLFEFGEVRHRETGEVYCHMPMILFLLTEPKAPLAFLGGTIIISYALDPDRKRGLLFHLWDAFISWWRYQR